MADTKVSALSAASTLDGTEVLPIVQGGASKKVTVSQIGQYPGAGGLYNASVANQGAGFATDTYLTGSNVAVPTGLQAKTFYRCEFNVSKTGAGVATPIITIRVGTNGSTADTSRCALTFAAQTGVIDEGFIEVWATFRTVGSGTSAVIVGVGRITHRLATTGLSTSGSSVVTTTGGGFDSTVANSQIGISVNGGTNAAWTVNLVQAQIKNVT